MAWFWMGLVFVAAGGAMQGSFALPQKFIRGWAWEKTWLLYSFAGMIMLPCLAVLVFVPNASHVYGQTDVHVLVRTAVFGFGWGTGSVLFGLGIARVGMALGFAIIIPLAAGVGSFVPLAVLHPGQVWSRRGGLLVAGLVLVTVGLFLYARAGALKEAAGLRSAIHGEPANTRYGAGLAICITSGLLSSLMNFSFVFGEPIAAQAVRQGATQGNASFAIFAVAVTSGFAVNAGYCIYLLIHNRSWVNRPGSACVRNTLYAIAMGVLWFVGYVLYGQGATALGEFGPALGWPLFMILMVLTANLWSLATGEWSGAGHRALCYLAFGMGTVLLALVVIAAGAQIY